MLLHPQPSLCPPLSCPSRGKTHDGNLGVPDGNLRVPDGNLRVPDGNLRVPDGNLRVHDSLKNRWKCKDCGTTFSGRRGTALYGLKSDPQLFVGGTPLLADGGSLPAIAATFGREERTVAEWQRRAGEHCRQVHEALVQTPQDLGQGQEDEVYVRLQKRVVVWRCMAIAVPTRLWLGQS